MLFRGAGEGSTAGAPVEAVIRDLCDLRESVGLMKTAMADLKAQGQQGQAVLEDIRGLLMEMRDGINAGLAESDRLRTAISQVRQSVDADVSLRARGG